jgi:hypothetical protein
MGKSELPGSLRDPVNKHVTAHETGLTDICRYDDQSRVGRISPRSCAMSSDMDTYPAFLSHSLHSIVTCSLLVQGSCAHGQGLGGLAERHSEHSDHEQGHWSQALDPSSLLSFLYDLGQVILHPHSTVSSTEKNGDNDSI